MKWIVPLLFLATPAMAQTCPPNPAPPQMAGLMAAVKDAPNEMAARRITNQLWEIWATAPDAKAQELLDAGMTHRASWNLEAAIEAFDALIAYCPDYAEGYNQRGFVHFIRQDYARALEDLDKAIERSPEHFAAIAGKALTLMGLDRMEAAQGVLRRALALNPWLTERNLLIDVPGTDL